MFAKCLTCGSRGPMHNEHEDVQHISTIANMVYTLRSSYQTNMIYSRSKAIGLFETSVSRVQQFTQRGRSNTSRKQGAGVLLKRCSSSDFRTMETPRTTELSNNLTSLMIWLQSVQRCSAHRDVSCRNRLETISNKCEMKGRGVLAQCPTPRYE